MPLTPRSSSPSSRCRGTTVTSSISQRKATSGGVKPGGKGDAMMTELRLFQILESRGEGEIPRGVGLTLAYEYDRCTVLSIWKDQLRAAHHVRDLNL